MKTAELIKRCQKKDPIAQELLYAKYANQLFRTAFRYLKNKEEAEDILIVALNIIFDKITNFKAKEDYSFEAWMKRIVINQSLMALRKTNNFALTASLDDTLAEDTIPISELSDAEEIYTTISQLPTGYRTIFNLHAIEGYNHDEIGDMLGINAGTSRSQLYKAKQMLKKQLELKGYQYGT